MSKPNIALVVTSINSPNRVIADLAAGATNNGWPFIVIGDKKSPDNYSYPGVDYYSLAAQQETGLEYAKKCPVGHYARKNIGYLIAARNGATMIVETDDDNIPRENFWKLRNRFITSPYQAGTGWVNVYRYFSDALIWPRGLPLDAVHGAIMPYADMSTATLDCPIQQGLADENPDVDAVYRLLLPLPMNFSTEQHVTLSKGAWCPFNSQNTTWWSPAFPLMYLPAYCSFRMTDIWRSFVAQRIAWECGWSVYFHPATVWQERNEHNLMRDFFDEIPGYVSNATIKAKLADLPLRPGVEAMSENLLACYRMLVSENLVGGDELSLLEAWLQDLDQIEGQFVARLASC